MAEAQAPVVDGFHDLELVGVGGFSAVYRGTDDNIDRFVAIKVFRDFDRSDPRSKERFLREARAMGQLSGSRYIVDIYQATFTAEGRACIVMPLMEGGSLAERIQREGRLPVAEVLRVGACIADALDEAHRRGMRHRDIKPENILLDRSGEPGLADFGLAVMDRSRAGTQTQLALTPPHASPERLMMVPGEAIDEVASDIYSLGSTLYNALAGEPPFGPTGSLGLGEFIRRVCNTPAPELARRDVPAQMRSLLNEMLAKEPSARPGSAAEVATRLRSIVLTEQQRDAPGLLLPPLTEQARDDRSGRLTVDVGGDDLGIVAKPVRSRSESATTVARAAESAPRPQATVDRDNSAPPAERTVFREERRDQAPPVTVPELEQPPSHLLAIVGGCVAVVLVVVVLAIVLTRSRSADDAAVTPPTTVSGTPAAELLAPTIRSVDALDDGGLSFSWTDPNTGFHTLGYRVEVDGQAIGSIKGLHDGDGTELVTITELGAPLDPVARTYCVVIVPLGADGPSSNTARACLENPGSGSEPSSEVPPFVTVPN